MIDQPTFRAFQDMHIRIRAAGDGVRDIETDVEDSRTVLLPALSGDMPPSVAAVTQRFAHVDQMSIDAAIGRSKDFTVFEGGDIRVEVLKKSGLGYLMARLGLSQFVRYVPYDVITRERLAHIQPRSEQ